MFCHLKLSIKSSFNSTQIPLWWELCNHLIDQSCASIVADWFASCSDTRASWSVGVAMLHLACLIGREVKLSNLIPEIHTGLISNQSCTWKEGIIHCRGLALWPRQWPSWKHYLVVVVEQCAISPLAGQGKAAQACSAFLTPEHVHSDASFHPQHSVTFVSACYNAIITASGKISGASFPLDLVYRVCSQWKPCSINRNLI